MTTTRRIYDHRFRELVRGTGNIQIATRIGVPRSTARGWARCSTPEVVTVDILDRSTIALEREVSLLRERNAKLIAVLRLLVVLTKVLAITFRGRRVIDRAGKERVLRAVERSRTALSLRLTLRILGLSSSRYHAWRGEQECALDDVSSCPRTCPHQLTAEELRVIRDMATSDDYRHVPTGTLAILAQRLGKVFASSATWYRIVRRHRLRRPRRRVHPQKPKVGIRAASPNLIWHVDTTVIRLLDGTRAYLHAVIDNFSRRVLAWRVSERFEPVNTIAILLEATRGQKLADVPTLVADAGVENVNTQVDELVASGALRRILAMTEVAFSNSMIESWWRMLKHQWLYLNTLDTVSSLRRLVAFYVEEHNTRLPHSAFAGQTPDEMYFGTGWHVSTDLASRRQAARRARLEANRVASCELCQDTGE